MWLGLKDIVPQDLSIGAALVALRQKQVDAVIQVIGVPADSVRDALEDVPLRLLPLSERGIAALARCEDRVLSLHDLARCLREPAARRAWRSRPRRCSYTAGDLSDAEVAALTRLVFANRQRSRRAAAAARCTGLGGDGAARACRAPAPCRGKGARCDERRRREEVGVKRIFQSAQCSRRHHDNPCWTMARPERRRA
ncbi:hypothetical protein ACU4GD_37165 [Cupriavidus basilensis]